jgi:NADPH:quinone reductase-like Zn-dependent oxidoreductase
MKAIVIDGYGGPERLLIREQPEPTPGPGELLIRVRAAGVNPVDWKIARGELRAFLWIRFPYIPGGDLAGEVVEVGEKVTRFKPGDAVFALATMKRGGAYAEFAVVNETAAAKKPESLSFVEAASLPIAGLSALQSLRDLGGLRADGTALIHGASGGVGHFGVQIAHALGAKTTATCGPKNVEFVQALGADLVIDYTREDFTRRADHYDVILDAAAKSSFTACRKQLAPGGTYVRTVPSADLFFWIPALAFAGLFSRAKKAKVLIARPIAADLAFLGQLADEGRLRPAIDRTFPLESAREAHEQSALGHTRGKIVLEV